jgi:hypothetical protein
MTDQTNAPQGTEAAAPESTTTEQTTVETPQEAPQATPQADTTEQESKVSQAMSLESTPEPENSEENQPSIDDIVDEALSGELSEETQKLIDENGLGKHIDMLVAGHKALQEKNDQEVYSVVGGKDSYAELQEWAKNNLSDAEKESVNKALFSGDLELAKIAIQGVQSRYVAANGKAPDRVIEGGGTANEDSRPFSSRDEYLAEVRNIKYKQDPEYRKQVEAKRNISGF